MMTQRKIYTTIIVGIALLGLVYVLGFVSYRFSPLYLLGGLFSISILLIVLRNPWHGLLLLAFFIPFERIGSADIGGITIRPSQITALLTMASLAFHALASKQWSLPRQPLAGFIAAFIAVSGISLINAPNLERSIMVYGFIVFTMLISVMVPWILRTEKQVKTLLTFFFASYLIVTLFGLYQFAGDLVGLPPELTGLRELYTKDVLGFPRVQSTALEPLYFANYLLIPLSVLLAFFYARKGTMPQWMVVGLLGLGSVNLILTVARGGYIAFAVSALLLTAYAFVEKQLLNWRNVGIATVLLVIGGIAATQLLDITVVTDDLLSHVVNLFEGASYNERIEMFEIALRAWQQHPWIGIGAGSIGPFAAAHAYYVPEHGWAIVNNEYLELLAEHGILGLFTVLALFIAVIVRSLKAITVTTNKFIRTVLLGILAAFCGILVQYNTFSTLYIVHIWFTIGLLVALQNIALDDTTSHNSR